MIEDRWPTTMRALGESNLATPAKELDDMIAKTAKMQKCIVEEIQGIGLRDHVKKQRMSSTLKFRRRKNQRG
jgi:hypothetical protein